MLHDDHSTAQPTEASERNQLAPFVVATGDAAPRDQRDLMERPFFSLAKAKRTAPILYESAGVRVEVFGMAEYGMATIWDADVLIWAASQIVAAENNGLPPRPRPLRSPRQHPRRHRLSARDVGSLWHCRGDARRLQCRSRPL